MILLSKQLMALLSRRDSSNPHEKGAAHIATTPEAQTKDVKLACGTAEVVCLVAVDIRPF